MLGIGSQIELRDRAGSGYELRGGTLARVPANSVTAPSGYTLTFDDRWTLLRGGRVVERFAWDAPELGDTGTVLTSFRAADDGAALRRPSHATWPPARGPCSCRVGAARSRVRRSRRAAIVSSRSGRASARSRKCICSTRGEV